MPTSATLDLTNLIPAKAAELKISIECLAYYVHSSPTQLKRWLTLPGFGEKLEMVYDKLIELENFKNSLHWIPLDLKRSSEVARLRQRIRDLGTENFLNEVRIALTGLKVLAGQDPTTEKKT
jgi:hypothetical protein